MRRIEQSLIQRIMPASIVLAGMIVARVVEALLAVNVVVHPAAAAAALVVVLCSFSFVGFVGGRA